MERSRRSGLRAAFLAAALLIAPAPTRAQVVPAFDPGTGALADVRLGIALATIAELLDAPALLARPSVQEYVDGVFADLDTVANDVALRARASRVRGELRSGTDAPAERIRVQNAFAALTNATVAALPAARDRRTVVGIVAQSIAYDARVLRSPLVDTQLRKTLALATAADGTVAGLAALRTAVTSARGGDWPAIATAAMKLTTAIAGPDGTAFPETSGVWVVLLRSATVAPAFRRGTPHLWLDVVSFDGTHRTIGATPDDADYAHDSARLSCDVGRDPAASERAIPIVPPPGTSSAQLADMLLARCAAATSLGPYHHREATDARFIVDSLLGAGVDAAAALHEASAPIR